MSQPACSIAGAPVPGPDPIATPRDERFEARTELGAGGMGRVRLARDRWLGRLVAIKEPITESDARRLWREALITSRLEHPGIVPIYDLGLSPEGSPWYAMRVVRGRSLAELLAAATTPEERLRLLRPVLAATQAIAYAHDQGVVHRDLKPANLMVGAFGEMQVIDWGLALAPEVPDVDRGAPGTLAYMAPEQARGETAGRASDVWSLGAVLHEIASGRSVRAGVADARHEEAARRGEREALPTSVAPELAAIVERATAPNPAERYPDAKALADDLERYLDGRRVSAHNYSPGELLRRLVRAWRVPLAMGLASLVVLGVVVALGVAQVRRERDAAEANLASARVHEAQTALDDDRHGEALRLASLALGSTDAGVVAEARGVLAAIGAHPAAADERARVPCTAIDVAPERVLCRDAGGLSSWHDGQRAFTHPRDVDQALFLDGGRAVLWVEGPTLRVVDADHGTPLATFDVPCPAGYGMRLEPSADHRSATTWHNHCAALVRHDGVVRLDPPCAPAGLLELGASPDGRTFVGACDDGTLVSAAPGAAARKVYAGLGTVSQPPMVTALAFVGDGTLWVGAADGGLSEIALGPTPSRVALPRQHGMVRRIAVAPDASSGLVFADASAPLLLDVARRAERVRLPGEGRLGAVAFDAEGRLWTASRTADGARLERWEIAALLPRRLWFAAGVTALGVSPRGDWVAAGDGARLLIVDRARRVVTTHEWQGGLIKTAAFTPEGALVAHGLGEMSVRVFDPLRATAPLAAPRSIWRRIAVLRDGAAVASNYRDEQYLLRRDHEPTPVGRQALVDLVASADGKLLASLDKAGVVRCGEAAAGLAALGVCARVPTGRALAIDDTRLAVIADGGVRLIAWRVGDQHLLPAPGAELASVALGPDAVAAGAKDGAVWVWRGDSERAFAIVRAHRQRVDHVAFSGATIVSGGWDGALAFTDLGALDAPR